MCLTGGATQNSAKLAEIGDVTRSIEAGKCDDMC